MLRTRPKVMAILNGRPFLEYLILQAKMAGMSEILLLTGHLSGQISDHFGDGSDLGVKIRYSIEEAPLGTAGSVRNGMTQIESDNFVLMNGDTFCNVNLKAFVADHAQSNAEITLVVHEVEDCSAFGRVEVSEDKQILEFLEKGMTSGRGLVNAGIYCIKRDVLPSIPNDKPVSMEHQVLPRYAGVSLRAYPSEAAFFDIGTPASLRRARRKIPRLLEAARLEKQAARHKKTHQS